MNNGGAGTISNVLGLAAAHWWIIAAAVIAAAIWIVWMYNRLVRDHNLVKEAWSGMDVQLQRRGNLIPNLVQVVKGYSAHEQRVLTEVTELRARGQQAQSLADRRSTENALTDALKRLIALAEAYPDLKASEEFLRLHQSLVEIEGEVQMSRRYYNGATRNFNILVESFPSSLVARVFGFKRQEFFEVATTSERQAPQVQL